MQIIKNELELYQDIWIISRKNFKAFWTINYLPFTCVFSMFVKHFKSYTGFIVQPKMFSTWIPALMKNLAAI